MFDGLLPIWSNLFDNSFRLLKRIHFPGTSLSIFNLLTLVVAVNVIIFLVRTFVGLAYGDAMAVRSYKRNQWIREKYGNNKNIKIDEKRKNDTK